MKKLKVKNPGLVDTYRVAREGGGHPHEANQKNNFTIEVSDQQAKRMLEGNFWSEVKEK